MYSVTIFLHSWLRYVVLGFGLWLLLLSFRGMRADAAWTEGAQRAQRLFIAALNVQFVLGLALYVWLSPITQAAFANMGAAMKEPQLRFWGVEHVVTMIVAIGVAHMGSARGKRKDGAARYRTTFRFTLAWLVLTLLAIPWPWLDIGRPLFRL